MLGFWKLLLIFSTIYTVHPGRHWVTAQSPTDPPVYQPDEKVSVNIGDSATLQCCVSEKLRMMAWFKQATRKKPRIIFKFFATSGERFYNGFQESRFRIERSSNCSNMTILNTTQSDEATYYCAMITPSIVFGDGTYLQIK
ncbi:uncharacterized protein LOC113646071, partial [Tachysurus ichikawai]